MAEKTEFEVTEKAGVFVAGRRSPGVGKTLTLTEAEAYHAEQLGELKPTGGNSKGKPAKPAAGDDGAN